MEKIKITAKMKEVINAVKSVRGEGAFAREILNFLDESQADRTELKTFNSVNATLAYCAKAGVLTSSKGVFGDKMLTKYAINDNTPDFEEKKAE